MSSHASGRNTAATAAAMKEANRITVERKCMRCVRQCVCVCVCAAFKRYFVWDDMRMWLKFVMYAHTDATNNGRYVQTYAHIRMQTNTHIIHSRSILNSKYTSMLGRRRFPVTHTRTVQTKRYNAPAKRAGNRQTEAPQGTRRATTAVTAMIGAMLEICGGN